MNVLQRYYDYLCGRFSSKNTIRCYYYHPKKLLEHINKPLSEITQDDVSQYVQYCFRAKKRNGNAIRFWSIRKFFEWANIDLEIPTVSPCDAGKLSLNRENHERLLSTVETLNAEYRLIFYLLNDAIRRPDEIRTLKIGDLHGDILRYNGKTGIKHCVCSQRLLQAWYDYLKMRPQPKTKEDESYLFINSYGPFRGKYLRTRSHVSKAVKEICLIANIDVPDGETTNSYLLKRTTITRQLKKCPDPKIIQVQAGHTKLSTTMKYNRINDDDIRNYLETLDDKRNLFKEKRYQDDGKSFLSTGILPQKLNKPLENDSYSFSVISFSDFFKNLVGVRA